MAKVFGQVAGGRPLEHEASTIKELKEKMAITGDHSALIDGKPVDDSATLSDYNVVTFAAQVKGA